MLNPRYEDGIPDCDRAMFALMSHLCGMTTGRVAEITGASYEDVRRLTLEPDLALDFMRRGIADMRAQITDGENTPIQEESLRKGIHEYELKLRAMLIDCPEYRKETDPE